MMARSIGLEKTRESMSGSENIGEEGLIFTVPFDAGRRKTVEPSRRSQYCSF